MRYGALLRVSKNASMVLLGTFVRMGLAFAFLIYLARSFGVEFYGKFTLTLNLFETFLSLGATGLCILVTRETAKDSTWLHRNLAASMLIVSLLGVVAAVSLSLVAFAAGCAGRYAPDTQMALYIASTALLPASLATLAEAIFVAWERAEFVAAGTAGESFLRTGLCFVLLWSGFGLMSLFISLIFTKVLQLLVYSVLIRRNLTTVEWQIQPGSMKPVLRQWRVFAAENWLSIFSNGMDEFLLSLFHGEAAVGVYDAAWKLIRLSSVFARALTTAIFPYISRLYVRAEETFHRVSLHSVKYMMAGLLPVVVCISVLSERIVLFLYGPAFASTVPVLQILAWLMIPQFLNPFLSFTLFARHEQHRSLIVATVNFIVFMGVGLLAIPAWGPIGAAVAMLSSSATALCCYLAFCVWGRNTLGLLIILARQAVAASVLCTFLYCMRNSELLPVVAIGALLYAAMLVALRIVNWRDVKLLQELH
jgi:O-antigen/teichoic acid export membrane protein